MPATQGDEAAWLHGWWGGLPSVRAAYPLELRRVVSISSFIVAQFRIPLKTRRTSTTEVCTGLRC